MKRTIVFLTLGLMIAATLSNHYDITTSQSSDLSLPHFHASSGNLSKSLTNGGSSVAAIDEQLGMTFMQSFSSLTYNVTAVAQQDTNNYGPAYLLNGLTNEGYWYQLGISFNWPATSGQYTSGFNVNYNVFNSKGDVVLPPNGSGGVTSTTGGSISQGDNVGLSLSFSGSNVIMRVNDWTSGATQQITYSSEGATQFIGLSTPANSNGFFTGLMTEQYHDNPYTGTEESVQYSNTVTALSSAVLWVDEYNVNTLKLDFGGNQSVSFSQNPSQLQSYTLDNATESANANNFISGSANTVNFILSYSVVGGGTTESAPTFSYTSYGAKQSVALTTFQLVYVLDAGSSWSVTNPLSSSTSTERWETNQTTSGSALSATTLSFVYYHQFLVQFGYAVIGAGSGYSAPSVTTFEFGSKLSLTIGQKTWVDAGSQYSYTNPLSGGTQTQRWQAVNSSSVTGQISSSTNISPQYYHQFTISAEYSVTNSGLPTAGPIFTFESFGTSGSSTLSTTPVSYWADAGTSYNASSSITGLQERWITNSSTVGTVSSGLSLNFVYSHQYYLSMQTPAGGTVNPTSEWVNDGNSVPISSTATQGWKFEFWTGTGTGSYSGNSNTTTVLIEAPITENATFYVGLTIISSSGGSVTYNSVPVPTQAIVYIPAGTVVTFNANPSSFLYKLDSWSGVTSGSSGQTSVTITSPSTVEAQFGYNFVNIGGMAAATVIIIAAVAVILSRRKSV